MDSFAGFFTFLLVVSLIAAMFTTVGFATWWGLGPLDRAAKYHRYPSQFSLADFLCLFVLVQLPYALIRSCMGESGPAGGALYVFSVLPSAAAWWLGVQTLSRAGIHVVWQRCAVLCICIPMTLVGALALCFLPPLAFFERSYLSVGSFVEVALVAVIWSVGRFTRRIVAEAERQRAQEAEAVVEGGPGEVSD